MEKIKKFKYEGLNEHQLFVINKFTKFRSATELEKQIGDLTDNNIKDEWVYNGFRDSGYMGGDHCSKGHSLRYVHYAKNKKTGEKIKFGIKCISDFFDITEDQLKVLQNGFVQTNFMVDQILEKFRSGKYDFDKYVNKVLVLKQKPKHYEAIMNLLYVYLPLPDEYEREILFIYNKQTNREEFEKFLDENPKHAATLVMAKLCRGEYLNKYHLQIDKKIEDIFNYLDKHGKLTIAQINLLEKLGSINYNEIDDIIADISLVDTSKFKRFDNYNERVIYLDLVKSYNEYGLTTNQINLLKKIYNNLKTEIDRLKLQDLSDEF